MSFEARALDVLRRVWPAVAAATGFAVLAVLVAEGPLYGRGGAELLYVLPAVLLAVAYGVGPGGALAVASAALLAHDTGGFADSETGGHYATTVVLLGLGVALGAYARRANEHSRALEQAVGELRAAAASAAAPLEIGSIDAVTGLPDRHALEALLPRLVADADSAISSLAVLSVSLENLGVYRDSEGILTCDLMLSELAAIWHRRLRERDLLARVGDGEFVAVLPGCSPANAERIARRLAVDVPDGQGLAVGVVCWDGEESHQRLLARATLERRSIAAADLAA